jgi:hypothetical protein
LETNLSPNLVKLLQNTASAVKLKKLFKAQTGGEKLRKLPNQVQNTNKGKNTPRVLRFSKNNLTPPKVKQ